MQPSRLILFVGLLLAIVSACSISTADLLKEKIRTDFGAIVADTNSWAEVDITFEQLDPTKLSAHLNASSIDSNRKEVFKYSLTCTYELRSDDPSPRWVLLWSDEKSSTLDVVTDLDEGLSSNCVGVYTED